MIKKLLFLVHLLMLTALAAWGQTAAGVVVDSQDQPVPGASVIVKGTSRGTMTLSDGTFSLTALPGSVLEVSCIGYLTQDVAAAPSLRIVLAEDNLFLEESVVTALGIRRERKALGYSVSEVDSKELLKNKQANVVNSLVGKVPGVNVTQSSGAAGAGATIIIRGANSTSEGRDNTPLFVVDGVIYDNSTNVLGNSSTDGTTRSNTTFANRVMDINPEDIESISVLKGAAAAALYGSRAADGAIIITTKKGAEGAAKVEYSGKVSVSWANRLPQAQTQFGRGYYENNGVLNTQTYQTWGPELAAGEQIYDNIGGFFQKGVIFDNSVNVSGGSKNGSFYLSLSNFNQKGVVPNTGYDKTTIRFNGEQKVGKRLTVSANAAYSWAVTAKTLTSGGLYNGGGSGSMNALYTWPITEDVTHYLKDDGTKYRLFEGVVELADDKENPYWIINKDNINDKTSRFTGAVSARLDILDWWDITGRVGYDQYTTDAYTYIAPGSVVKDIYQNGRLSKSDYNYRYVSTNLMSNMHRSFGPVDLGLLLGITSEDTQRHNQTHWGYDFITAGTISFNNIPTENQFFTDRSFQKRLVGVYGELRAAYKNIAFLTVTGRNDWSSTLPKSSRSYFYPSVSGAFVFSELIPQNNILSFGKVRLSWARVGKDANPYATLTYLESPITYGSFTGVGNQSTSGNIYLVPEIQTAWEIGAELKFLDGRIGLDWTYYHSRTANQIASPRLSQASGFSFTTINSGSVINRGQELALSFIPVSNRNWDWTIVLNASYNRGTLGDFLPGVNMFYPTDAQFGTVKAASVPNGGIFLGLVGTRYEYETDADGNEITGGRYVIDPTTGLYKVSAETSTVVGNREPRFIGGLGNTVRYKNLTVSFLLDFRFGGAVYNGTEYLMAAAGMSKLTTLNNRQSVTLNGVVKENDAWVPREIVYEAGKTYTVNNVEYSGEAMIQKYWSNYLSNSYNFITDVNWLKLRSLTVSYDFSSLLKKTGIVKGLSVTATGNNLFTITNYKGMDPEVSTAGGTGGSGATGIDYASVPAVSSVSFGVNVVFGAPQRKEVAPVPEPIVREVVKEVVKEKIVEKEVIKEVVKEVPASTLEGVYVDDLYFQIGKAELRPEEAVKLGEIARLLKDNPHARISITGYADSATGSARRNESLSAQRARTVVQLLKKAGIGEDRITFTNVGSDKDASLAPEANRVAVCVVK